MLLQLLPIIRKLNISLVCKSDFFGLVVRVDCELALREMCLTLLVCVHRFSLSGAHIITNCEVYITVLSPKNYMWIRNTKRPEWDGWPCAVWQTERDGWRKSLLLWEELYIRVSCVFVLSAQLLCWLLLMITNVPEKSDRDRTRESKSELAKVKLVRFCKFVVHFYRVNKFLMQ